MKIEIKHRFNGAVLFAHEAKENNLRATLLQAVKARADLSRADLSRADLSGADLSRANLSGANLSGADLSGADLSRANLSGADLSRADLPRADLSRADLSGADLSRANLSGADLSGALNTELLIASTRILPEGDLIGWKLCRDKVAVKLRIPSLAKRSHAFGRKCRAEYAEVLEVFGADVGISQHDGKTEYKAGMTVYPDNFSDAWQEECTNGIHFFITRLEAENYV
jgi:hypothetical protein